MISAALLDEDILTLGMRADQVRRAGPGGSRVRYQRVHLLSAADVGATLAIPEAASEARLLDAPASFADALELVSRVKLAAGARPVRAFSLVDLLNRARGGWGDLHAVLAQLAAAGAADVAQLPMDGLDDVAAAVRTARAAGMAASRLTVSHPVADKIGLLTGVRALIDQLGGIARVAPLPQTAPLDQPTTGYDDVRTVALARLAMPDPGPAPAIAIEVDWLLYGPKLAQVALTFGADFLDAVPATSDAALGRRRQTVEDVERNIRAAGFEPEEYRPAASAGFHA